MQSYILISSHLEDHQTFLNEFYNTHAIDLLDITIFIGETSIGIDDIKKLQKQLLFKPLRGSSKALILHNAQVMTPEAQNAFLKTLEEPPLGTFLFLITNSTEGFLPTILSRCKVITLSTEGKTISPDEKKTLATEISLLFSEGIQKKLVLAQTLGENKNTATDWLEKAILYLREQLLDSMNSNPIDLAEILGYFQETYTIIRTTNVNPRFALEQLFLAMPTQYVH